MTGNPKPPVETIEDLLLLSPTDWKTLAEALSEEIARIRDQRDRLRKACRETLAFLDHETDVLNVDIPYLRSLVEP